MSVNSVLAKGKTYDTRAVMTISARMLPFAVLFCAVLWGSAFPGIKAIYAEWERVGIVATLPNRMLLAGVRFVIAGVVLLLLAKQPWKEWKKTDRKSLLCFAITQTTFQYLFFYTALSVSSAIMGGLLVATGSFWWLLLAPLILKTPWPNQKQWSLMGIGALGVLLAVYKPGAGSGNPALGALLFCCSTLSGAVGIVILQRVLPTMGARAATGFGLLIGGSLLVLFGMPAWGNFTKIFTPNVIWLTAYLSFVSATGFGLWNHLTQLFPVNLLAGYRFFIPICAVVLSSIFVAGESPGWGIFVGGVLVISSVIFLQRLQNQ